jgi:hypothetical protein
MNIPKRLLSFANAVGVTPRDQNGVNGCRELLCELHANVACAARNQNRLAVEFHRSSP